ncbi:MAG: hypothetical protein JOZ84_05985 [Methylobacteriaceae bacterium]|nr:hypothetical protein [Methylobacteriaceae bacterium]
MVGFEVLTAAAAVAVVSSVVKEAAHAIFGLLAKRTAKQLLKENVELVNSLTPYTHGDLNDPELSQVKEKLLKSLELLPEREKGLVTQGLTQRSKSGERRYIEELITSIEGAKAGPLAKIGGDKADVP